MAFAVLKFRRGTTPTTTLSEPYYNTDRDTLQIGNGGTTVTLARLGENTGSIQFSGDITADNITATGDLTIGGNLFLGDNIADNIVISGELSSSIIPNDDNEFDLGSTSKRWRNLYVASATIDNVVLNGSGIVSSSQQISDYNTFLEINGDGVFSGSSQVNADSITNFDSNVKDKMNDDGVISGSSQLTTEFDTRYLNTNGDSVISSSAQLTTEFDTRYLNTEGDSVVSSSAQISNYNTFLEINGDGVFSGSSQVDADSITNFDSNVKDKMNADNVISGSSQLEGEFLQINGDSVVSSSDQVDFLQLNNLPNGIVSGSDQVNSYIVGTTYSQSVDSRLDSLETDSHTHSNKAQLDTINQNLSTTSDITFNDGDFTGDVTVTGDLTVLGSATEIQTSELRIEDKLITVASGSADSAAADGAGLEIDGANKSLKWEHGTQQFVFDAKVSSSVGFKGNGSELTGINAGTGINFDGTSIVSSSQQISNYNTFLEINGDSVVSGSQQVIDLLPEGTISGSSQVAHDSTTGFVASEHIDHSSITLGSGKGLTGGGTIDVSRSLTLATGSTHFTEGVVSSLPSGTVSGSSQITITESQISDLDKYTDSDTLAYINSLDVHSGSFLGTATTSDLSEGSNLYYTNTRVLNYVNDLGVISGSTFSSPSQGTVRATINGVNTDVDTGLESTDSPSFQGLTLTNLSSLGAGNVTALISGSGGSIGKRSLGTAAFFNTSASIGDDPNSVPTTKAVNDALISAGAGDITEVNPTNTFSPEDTGLIHLSSGTDVAGTRGVQGNIHIAVATGSLHFTEGVVESLPNGVISGSSQITSLSSITHSGDLTINNSGDLKITNSDNAAGRIYLGDTSGTQGSSLIDSSHNLEINIGTTVNNSALYIQHNGTNRGIFNSSGFSLGTGANVNTILDSGDAFVDNDTSLMTAASIDDRINASLTSLNSATGSYLTELPSGVVSGSSQITDGSDIVSGSVIRNFNGTNIVSSSTQISNFNKFLEINGDNVVSSSLQINSLFTGTAVSTSLDSRIDALEAIDHSHSNKANLDTINQNLSTTDNVTFGDGNFGGNVEISGNLTVVGSSTELQVSELRVEDKLITLASGSTTSLQADGGGIEIAGANNSFTWDHSNSRFVISTDTRVSGDISATGDIIAFASSDKRLKNNIIPIENPLDKISKISGNSFEWNEEKQNIYKGKDYGVIAQEIEEILPELVQTREDGYKAVKYDKIVSLLIEGIKELNKEVTDLKKIIGDS